MLLAVLLSLNDGTSVDQTRSDGPHLKIASLPEVQLEVRGPVAERGWNRNTEGSGFAHLEVALKTKKGYGVYNAHLGAHNLRLGMQVELHLGYPRRVEQNYLNW